jgi:capsular exopolysaccharide synthesis family protein
VVNYDEALRKAKEKQQALRRERAGLKEEESYKEPQPEEQPEPQPDEKKTMSQPVVTQPRPATVQLESYTNVDPRVICYFDPESLAAEQFRSIRTTLMAIQDETPRSMVITSASRGEGKSTVTANLGVTMAHDLDQRVLVIDGDLRRPSLARLFGFPEEPGLTDILMGRYGNSIDEVEQQVLRKTEVDRLMVLPPGDATSNPTELLGSRRMQELVLKLQERFTFVLIDSPPVVAVTDASVIGKMVEGTLLVVQAGQTRREVINRALSLLGAARNRVLGCVLNGIEYHIPNYIYRYI